MKVADAAEAAKAAEKRAFRLVKNLELPNRRDAAMAELIRIGKPALRPLILTLNDPRPEIVISALQVLGALGKQAEGALPALKKLERSKDPKLVHAVNWARSGIRRGVFLVVQRRKSRVVELTLDAAGKPSEKVVVKKLKQLWDAELLANGNYLVTQHTPSGVLEVDRAGKVVWSYKKLKHPMDADRLPGGTTLIADTQAGRVVEVDRLGRVVWEYNKGIRPNDVDRLPNGNTLITHANGKRVLEVNKAGKVVWEYEKADVVVDADRLLNGNTLVTVFNKKEVREVDATGKVLWRISTPGTPRDADRLPNGHTVVATDQAIAAFDKAGKKLWEIKVQASEITRY